MQSQPVATALLFTTTRRSNSPSAFGPVPRSCLKRHHNGQCVTGTSTSATRGHGRRIYVAAPTTFLRKDECDRSDKHRPSGSDSRSGQGDGSPTEKAHRLPIDHPRRQILAAPSRHRFKRPSWRSAAQASTSHLPVELAHKGVANRRTLAAAVSKRCSSINNNISNGQGRG